MISEESFVPSNSTPPRQSLPPPVDEYDDTATDIYREDSTFDEMAPNPSVFEQADSRPITTNRSGTLSNGASRIDPIESQYCHVHYFPKLIVTSGFSFNAWMTTNGVKKHIIMNNSMSFVDMKEAVATFLSI